MLCSGTFQHHLIHGTLDYLKAADVAAVKKKIQALPRSPTGFGIGGVPELL